MHFDAHEIESNQFDNHIFKKLIVNEMRPISRRKMNALTNKTFGST